MSASAIVGRKAVILLVMGCVVVMFAASFIYRLENPNLFVQSRASAPSGGESAMNSGPMSKIREYMDRVKENPEDVEALTGLGNSFLMMRAWDRALEPLNKAKALAPDNTAVLKGIGIAHFNKEEYDKAAEAYEAILKIDTGDTLALFNLGVIYKHYFQKPDVARTYFEKVLAMEKNDTEMIKLAKQELEK